MNRFTISDIIEVIDGRPVGADIGGSLRLQPREVSIDSRTLREGDLFIALEGERFDGHDFAEEALSKGALAAVVSGRWAKDRGDKLGGIGPTILVENTLKALQECARYYRSLFPVPLVAVTGTNGKTTTKDMIAAVLSADREGLWTKENQNNHIGLPLTVLRLQEVHRCAVVELGMRAPGEIAQLAAICNPQIGVITNVGPAHIQFFRSIEEIAEAKGELLDYLGSTGTAVLNGDDSHVMAQRERTAGKIITFGLGREADVRADSLRMTPQGNTSFVTGDGLEIELRVPGKHMVYNALAAVAVGRELGVPFAQMRDALAAFQPQPMRMECIHVDSLHILNDAYNANPASMRAALETLSDVTSMRRRIAVLGDMLELGEWAPRVHREIGALAGRSDLAYLFTVGELSQLIAEGALVSGMSRERVRHFARKQEAIAMLRRTVQSGDVVLVKGSRKMGLEEVVDGLRRHCSRSEERGERS